MSNGFQFKQFFVRHDKCSMKVGTDGVLIGAWASTHDTHDTPLPPLRGGDTQQRILDVGTGSGLIALMLAQRFADAQIDAIDIDEASCLQARENFNASPWAERLHAAHCSLQELSASTFSCHQLPLSKGGGGCPTYDLIVSNPPYFVNSLKAPDAARCAARHNDTLPFDVLMAESARRLKPNGTLALIVPCEAEDELQTLAAAHGLHCTRRCMVHPKPGRPAKRVMIAWTNNPAADVTPLTETLTLEDEHGGRSLDYQQLTRDFYL